MSELKDKALSGMFWATVERLSVQVVQFVIGLILARLLAPSDYGMIGLLSVFMAISSIFVDSGFGSALIQKRDCTQSDYSTIFYFNVVVSFLCYAIFYISAPYIAAFYNIPELTAIARVLFLTIPLGSFTGVIGTKLQIELNFKLGSKISIYVSILTGLIGIAAAYSGFGVWALVIQSLSGTIIGTILLYYFTRWHPSFVFSVRSLRQMFGFGSKLLVANVFGTIFENAYQLTIGKFCSAVEVGLYNRAFHFGQLPTNTIVGILLKVNYPLLTQYKDDDEALKTAYVKLLRTPMYLLYPILFLMAALARPMVLFLLGEKWIECALPISILAFAFLWRPLAGLNVYLLYVKGLSGTALKLDFFKKPVMITLLLVSLPFGLIWICVGRALYSFWGFAINCYYTKKYINYGFFDQIRDLAPILVYGMIASITAFATSMLFSTPFLQLVMGGLVGISSYILLSILLADKSFMLIVSIVKSKLFKR